MAREFVASVCDHTGAGAFVILCTRKDFVDWIVWSGRTVASLGDGQYLDGREGRSLAYRGSLRARHSHLHTSRYRRKDLYHRRDYTHRCPPGDVSSDCMSDVLHTLRVHLAATDQAGQRSSCPLCMLRRQSEVWYVRAKSCSVVRRSVSTSKPTGNGMAGGICTSWRDGCGCW